MRKEIQADLLGLCKVSEDDAELFVKWMFEQKAATNFDFKTLTYPRACMARVQKASETIAMAPLHPVLMIESLAHNPDLSESELILALARVNEQLTQAMRSTGMAEAFFITNNERFSNTCEKHGWIKAMFDPERHEWLMKRRANIDWAALLENKDASNDQPNA